MDGVVVAGPNSSSVFLSTSNGSVGLPEIKVIDPSSDVQSTVSVSGLVNAQTPDSSGTATGQDQDQSGVQRDLKKNDTTQYSVEIDKHLPKNVRMQMLAQLDGHKNISDSYREKNNLQPFTPLSHYYKSQNELLSSIDDIQQTLEHSDASNDDNQSVAIKATCLTATRIAKLTFLINFCLFSAKIVAAALSGSLSVLSSVIDSSVDLASGIILWWSSRAIKHVDYSLYPRGRRKLEPIAIIVLAVIMSFASVQVIYTSLLTIVDYASFDKSCNATFRGLANDSETTAVVVSGTVSDLVALLTPCMSGESGPIFALDTILICSVTVAIKLVLFLVCRTSRDETVQALALDQRNDVVSNTSAIVFGLIGYHLLKYMDAVGAILISIYIIVNWLFMARDQIRMLTGFTASTEFINMLTSLILKHDSRILYIDDVKAFHFGSKYFIEVIIVLPETMAIRESHDIGETLQIKLERLDQVERVFVHVDYECGYRHRLTRL